MRKRERKGKEMGRDGDRVRVRGGGKRGKGGLGGSPGKEESEEKSSGEGRQELYPFLLQGAGWEEGLL